MRHDKLSKELDLLLLLADPQDHSVAELCEELDISRRNLYYYLDFFKQSGFMLFKRNGCYHIDQRSPFLTRLLHLLQFTEDEAVTLRKLLSQVDDSNSVVRNLKYKLERYYDFAILADVSVKQQVSRAVNTLYEAIKQRRVVKLTAYSSPHSHTVSDRWVEPFQLMNNNNDVRAYEISSGCCKTFRLSRMKEAVMLDLTWSNEDRHRQLFTDIFRFSGEETREVVLRLGQLAHNVFLEEHPGNEHLLTPEDDNRWLLRLPVCDYRGIARFVLGLYDEVEVLGDDGLKQYLREKIAAMASAE